MGRVEYIFGLMLGLILVYLLVANASGATSIIGSLGSTTSSLFKTLQGR